MKRWQDGDMRKRWTAAGKLVAEQQFRRRCHSVAMSRELLRRRSPYISKPACRNGFLGWAVLGSNQ